MAENGATPALTTTQRMAILAAYLGWTLDAFDYFLLVFLLKSIAQAFGTDVKSVSEALFLTLAARPVGAFGFGWLADRYGRRPVLMVVVVLFSVLSAASGLAQSLGQLLLVRTLFGVAMGGEWGIGASLVMETIPSSMRGRVSGLLQAGYPSGYLLASLAFALLFDRIGWRGMFFLGLAPSLLVVLIRMRVEESPSFVAAHTDPARVSAWHALTGHWRLALYLIVLMAAFNAFSHGTQDLYPTFLQKQHHFDARTTGLISAVMNVGAITGALLIGRISDRIGRRRAIMAAASAALLAIPLWAGASSPLWLALGAFLIQAGVQGAWGVVPAHLNELSPPAVRAMFPGLVYQLGNLLASRNGVFQASLAESHGNAYGLALAGFGAVTAGAVILFAAFGPERKGAVL